MSLEETLALYLKHFPDDGERLQPLQSQIKMEGDIYSRKNMHGHMTASALILNTAGTQTLLIHHNIFNIWLQPGGHCDAEDERSLVTTALREAVEETGLQNVQLHPWHTQHPFPIDFDTHPIAARSAKNEAAHQHHDAMYLMVAPENAPLTAQLEEVSETKWFPLADLQTIEGHRLKRIYQKLGAICA